MIYFLVVASSYANVSSGCMGQQLISEMISTLVSVSKNQTKGDNMVLVIIIQVP